MSYNKKILVEVIGKGKGHWPSFYMHAAVKDVMPEYAEKLECRVLSVHEREGKDRLLELSCALYGKDAVYQKQRLAPIPSLFINGRLVFDIIPDRDALTAAIESLLTGEG